MGWGYFYKPYVSVAQRQVNARKHAAKLAKKTGRQCSPVNIDGRTIARTFWGKAWCDNLEAYSDFANRMPRGRTYVRNGSVIDLCIEPGVVKAIVSGSEIYNIKIKINPLAAQTWDAIKKRCAGQIASMVELLQGKLSQGVMQIITAREGGLFPKPAEIDLDCSCPDWADMCKHVAAALYGVGARLDQQPELLFTLRQVDHLDLIAQAGNVDALPAGGRPSRKTLAAGELADVFGIDLAGTDQPIDPVKTHEVAPVSSTSTQKKPAARRKARTPLHGKDEPSMKEGTQKPGKRPKAARVSKQ